MRKSVISDPCLDFLPALPPRPAPPQAPFSYSAKIPIPAAASEAAGEKLINYFLLAAAAAAAAAFKYFKGLKKWLKLSTHRLTFDPN